MPISFDAGLRVGDLVTATCVVRAGDSPLTLRWLRDDRPLPPASDDLVTRDTGDRISVLLIPHVRAAHVGRYTCEASNAAGTARVSATLVARGTAARDPSCPAGLLRRHSTGFGLSSVDISVLTRPPPPRLPSH